MFVTTDDDIQLNVKVEGREDAPVLLLMHSIGCDLRLWDPQISALAEDFRIVRYDARGHGESDAPAGDYTADRLGRDALAVLDAVGAERAYLCGLSLGGMTAQFLALHAPERVAGMIIANSAARIGTAEGWQERAALVLGPGPAFMATTAMTRFFSPPFRTAKPAVVDIFRQRFSLTSPQGYAGCCAVLRDSDFTEQLGAMSVPTIIIGGTLDEPTPLSQAEELAAGIPGARLVALDAGHLSNVERPAEFTAAIRLILETA